VAVNLFGGLLGPDDPVWHIREEAQRIANMVQGRGLEIARQHQALAEQARRMMGIDTAELVQRFASPLSLGTEFTDLARQIAVPLSLGNSLADLAQQIAPPLFAQPDLDLARSLSQLQIPGDLWLESERHLKSLGPKARELGRRGWTIAPRRAMTEFADVVDEISEDELDDAWLGLYTADEGAEFNELVETLGEIRLLDRWRRSLDGAVYAYRGGYFETALSSLLGCFEGALSAATKRLDRWHKLRTTAVEFRDQAEAEVFATRYLCWESLVGFTDAVFRDHPFNQAPPDMVNRHLVQHGRAMPPRPQVDCLQLLQALETLSLVVDKEAAAADPEPETESLV
jgi:hypothetical protein